MKYIYLAVISLIIAAVFIVLEKKEKYIPAVVAKGLASFCFVILGYLGNKLAGESLLGRRMVTGLTLGCIADVLLNLRFVFKKVGQPVFLVGILVFLSGHIFYIIGLIPQCKPLLYCLIAGIVLSFVVLKWIFSKIEAKKAFKIFGVFYIGAIVIMTCIAIGVLITNPCGKSWMFLIGALLFLVSDVVLILNTFGKESKFSLRITNLSLYYIGQILIALSLQLK